jgi:hypothetical protein
MPAEAVMQNCGKGFFTPAASVQNDGNRAALYGAPRRFRYSRMLLTRITERAAEKPIEKGIAEKGYLMKYLFRAVGRLAGALDFSGKTLRHRMVAQPLSHCDALFEDFDRTLNSAPAEQDAGLAKDLGVALTLFGSVHET